MNPNLAVIFDETQLPEAIHKKTHAGPGTIASSRNRRGVAALKTESNDGCDGCGRIVTAHVDNPHWRGGHETSGNPCSGRNGQLAATCPDCHARDLHLAARARNQAAMRASGKAHPSMDDFLVRGKGARFVW